MSSSPSKSNLAARMGGWSGRHRWTALGLWFAFVFAAIGIGVAVGHVNIPDSRLGDGESGHINRVIDDANFSSHAHEMVLVQSSTLTANDPAFKRGVRSVIGTLDKQRQVTEIESPYAAANAGDITKNGHSALVRFQITGDVDTAPDRVQPVMDAVAGTRAANPTFASASSVRPRPPTSSTTRSIRTANARNLSLPGP